MILFLKPGSRNSTRITLSLRLSTLEPPVILNITYINAAAFYIQSRYYKNTSFSTSLYELNRIINEREDLDDNATLEEIKAKVPV